MAAWTGRPRSGRAGAECRLAMVFDGRMAGVVHPFSPMEHQYIVTDEVPEIAGSEGEMLHVIDWRRGRVHAPCSFRAHFASLRDIRSRSTKGARKGLWVRISSRLRPFSS